MGGCEELDDAHHIEIHPELLEGMAAVESNVVQVVESSAVIVEVEVVVSTLLHHLPVADVTSQ